MNNFDDWSQIISKYLKSEADPLTSLTRHELEGDAARSAFIRSVLDRFLPEIYGVGGGQIMDSSGKLSGKMDIIIYRRDFPRLDLPGSRDIYLYESVIATVEVAAKLVKKTFFDALNRCASLAVLNPDINPKVMTGLAARNQLTMNENRQYVHPEPIRTARFHLVGRPISFIYAFNGYKTSPKQLGDTMQAWMDEREENHKPVTMKELPAVVATQGCFAWRNSAPFTVSENSLLGIGIDPAPVRLIVLQMLYVLSRRLRVTTDGHGLKPSLDGYLKRMPRPQMEFFIGKARNPASGPAVIKDKISRSNGTGSERNNKPVAIKAVVSRPGANKPAATRPSAVVAARLAVAKSRKTDAPVPRRKIARPTLVSGSKANIPVAPSKPTGVQSAAKAPNPEPALGTAANPGIEMTKRPSQPKPAIDSAASSKSVQELTANTLATLNPKPEAVDAPFPVPNADLVPELDPDPPSRDDFENEAINAAFGKLESSATAPKQTATDTGRQSNSVAATDSLPETVKMQVDMPEREKMPIGEASTSADDFSEAAKSRMASPEPIPHLQPDSEARPEPFTSTIPQ